MKSAQFFAAFRLAFGLAASIAASIVASIVTLGVIAVSHTVFSQPAMSQNISEADTRKLRLAQSYEQSGDARNAARLYQELYDANKPSNTPSTSAVNNRVIALYFDGVQRSLLALGQFAALLPLVEEALQAKQPFERTVDLLALKGDLLWRTGKQAQATETWSQALQMVSASPQKRDSAYIKIAFAQSGNRAFEAAIETFKQARSDLSKGAQGSPNAASSAPALFSDQLSQLYGAVGNFTAGTQEVLSLLRFQGAQNVARGRLSAYLISEKGTQQTREVLDRAANPDGSDANNVPLQRLYGWFLREMKDFDRALEVTIRLDALTNAQGREIYEFADAARRDAAYSPALKAFGVLIDKGKRSPYAPVALYGYARTAESKITESNERGIAVPPAEVASLIERYGQIIRDYPATEPALSAQYRIATLTREQLGKPEQALTEFGRIVEQFKTLPPHLRQAESIETIAARAAVDMGKTFIALERMAEAEQTFKQTLTMAAGAQNERDEAAFNLAELEYFRCGLDSARERFGRLAVNSNADIANDALEMLNMLEYLETPAGKDLLCKLAHADLQSRQNKFDAAVQEYTALAVAIQPKAREAQIGEQALLRAAKIERNRRRFEETIKLCIQATERFPEGTSGDTALLVAGDAHAALQRPNDAMSAYTKILVQFPRSPLAQEARMKIRKLRGDS